jgi:hypothetical protein
MKLNFIALLLLNGPFLVSSSVSQDLRTRLPGTTALYAATLLGNASPEHGQSTADKPLEVHQVINQLNAISKDAGLAVDGKTLEWKIQRYDVKGPTVEASVEKKVYDEYRKDGAFNLGSLAGPKFVFGELHPRWTGQNRPFVDGQNRPFDR